MRTPTFYIPHGGGPCFFMDWEPADTWHKTADWLRNLQQSWDVKPAAIVVISAHWETDKVTVNSGAAPPLLFDYYGFPPHTYALTWPAPGDPTLARRILELLRAAHIPCAEDNQRGFDHGVFVPFKLIDPEAKIPTVQLSLCADLDPARHIAIGAALQTLRDENVVIIGSGQSYHNMAGFKSGNPCIRESDTFDTWLTEACLLAPTERNHQLCHWRAAPMAAHSHPREEHLLPLMVVAGAAGNDPGKHIFRDRVMGATVSGFQFG